MQNKDSKRRIRANMDKTSFEDFKALCGFRNLKMEEFAGDIIRDYVQSELPKVFKDRGYGQNEDS